MTLNDTTFDDCDVSEINATGLAGLMRGDVVFVDVREPGELPELPVPHQRIPLSLLRHQPARVAGGQVVVVCHIGVRSLEAVRLLHQWAPAGQRLYSLKGGIMALAAVVQKEI